MWIILFFSWGWSVFRVLLLFVPEKGCPESRVGPFSESDRSNTLCERGKNWDWLKVVRVPGWSALWGGPMMGLHCIDFCNEVCINLMAVVENYCFWHKWSFKWHCNTIKRCSQLIRWMMYRWWCESRGDRAWWVIQSVFLRSPKKGFWGFTHRHAQAAGNLGFAMKFMLKLRGI